MRIWTSAIIRVYAYHAWTGNVSSSCESFEENTRNIILRIRSRLSFLEMKKKHFKCTFTHIIRSFNVEIRFVEWFRILIFQNLLAQRNNKNFCLIFKIEITSNRNNFKSLIQLFSYNFAIDNSSIRCTHHVVC